MGETIEKKHKKFEDFYQQLRKKINRWVKDGKLDQKTGKWTDNFIQYLLVLPDLVHLGIKMVIDKEISTQIKGFIIIGMVYLISPIDIIPDFIPVAGFIDDLLILSVILNRIINNAEPTVLEKIRFYWAGKDDVFEKVQEIIASMNELASKIPKSILKFMKKGSNNF